MVGDEVFDCDYKIFDGSKGRATDCLAGNDAEEVLNLVEPRAIGGGEVEVETG